ncbi:MAG TPA: hypothetical protein VGM92_06600 [Candidatus Kapabacteria bacterium]|jgi:hypothetical protein
MKQLPKTMTCCVMLGMIALLCHTASGQSSSRDSSTHAPSDSSGILRPAPTAFDAAGIDFSSALLRADYMNIAQSNIPSVSALGVMASVLTEPLNEGVDDGVFGPEFGLIAGYESSNFPGSGSNWQAGGSAIWNRPSLRLGAALGIQSSVTSGTSGVTFNYGAFLEWLASNTLTLFAKLGEFSGGSSGNYLGGNVLYYATPDFALNASVVSISFSGSYNFDLTLQGEYLFSETDPFAVEAGYTQSVYSGFHIGQVFMGMKFFVNGDGISSLIDRERNGELPPQQLKF